MPLASSAEPNLPFTAFAAPVESYLLRSLHRSRPLIQPHRPKASSLSVSAHNFTARMTTYKEKPRGYQSEILEHARKENVIAFLETGAGKTLVSALLIQEVLSQPASKGRIAVFIVEKVALVHQQAEYMKDICEYNVGTYYGAMGLDEWSSDRWLEEFSKNRILVMTAQIFLNALNHALIRMTSVAILVMDEVHHATGEHPFRRIMVDFYHTLGKNDKRPRIFGMTASPVKVSKDTQSVQDCAEAIAFLEATMDATIVVVSEDAQEELESLVPSAAEFVAEYTSAEGEEDDSANKEDELAINSGLDVLVPSLTHTVHFNDRSKAKGALRKSKLSLDKGSSKDMNVLLMKVHQALGRYVACFLSHKLAHTTGNTSYKYNKYRLTEGPVISDKIRVLLDLLVDARKRWDRNPDKKEEFRCIVFVHQRLFAFAVAWIITNILGELDEKCFEARAVVGCHAKSSHLRMSQTEQNEVLNDFRMGEFGVLVATNVVEEGLDIPACSLVVAFDAVLSAKAYIQARGRARSPGSHYIALIPRNITAHAEFMVKAYQGAQFMKATVKALNDQKGTEWRANLAADAQKIIDNNDRVVLRSNNTPARVLPASAIPLLQRYCWGLQNLRVDPVYELDFTVGGCVATVTLPELSPVRTIKSTPQTSEVLARRIAALKAYEELYRVGEVDDYLLPKMRIEKKTPGEPRRYRGTKGPKIPQRVRLCAVEHPPPLKRARAAGRSGQEIVDLTICPKHLYLIKRDRDPPAAAEPEKWRGGSLFGIILENKVEEDDLEAILCPTGGPLLTLEYVKEIELTQGMQNEIRNYMHVTEGCVRGHFPPWLSDIEKKEREKKQSDSTDEHDDEPSSPVSKNGELNEGYQETETDHTETEPTEVDEDSMERDKLKPKCQRRYEEKRRRELRRKDQPPGFFFVPLLKRDGDIFINWPAVASLGFFNISGDATDSTAQDWSYTFAVSSHETNGRVYFVGRILKGVTVKSKPQGLVSSRYKDIGEYYLKRHKIDLSRETEELLEAFSVTEMLAGDRKSPFPLCRKTCYHIPLAPWAVYTVALLPSWQTFLTLKQLYRKVCKNESIKFLSFSRSVQPNMGNLPRDGPELNYERNEFLGDAVLKLVSSMMAYANAPSGNEGLLTDHRDDEIANNNLCNIAVDYGLQHCIALTSITRKAKKWQWFWGIPQIETQEFSEKVLADCIEALIGAHYLEGGLESAVKFMDRLGVVVNAEVILKYQTYKYAPGSDAEEELRITRINDKRITNVEEILRYKFGSKDIVIEALTHGSFASGKSRSYQRLEFLGDAAIGFVLLARFFKENPLFTPGDLSAMREPALSNHVFARVVVASGLHKMLWLDCIALERDIDNFASLLRNETEGEDVCKSLTVPKALGDILESLVGAIVVDQGMRLDGLEDVVVRLMQPMLDKYANPESIDQHPVSRLSQMVQSKHGVAPEFVCIDIAKSNNSSNKQNMLKVSRGMARPSTIAQDYIAECSAMVNGKVLGKGRGPTRRVAKHAAAVDALRLFESEKTEQSSPTPAYFDI